MLTKEQKELRRRIVTASDCVRICGFYEGSGVSDVYASKLGFDTEETEAMQIGNLVEPVGLEMLRIKTGMDVRPCSETVVSETHPWAGCSPDGYVYEDGKIVAGCEVKCVGFRRYSEWLDDEPPAKVLAQVTYSQWVTKIPTWWVSAILGTECKIFKVDYNAELGEALAAECFSFYVNHMEPRVAPPCDGSDGAKAVLNMRFPRSAPNLFREPIGEDVENVHRYLSLKRQLDELETEKERVKQVLCAQLGSYEGIKLPDMVVSWKSTKTGQRRFTVKEFK